MFGTLMPYWDEETSVSRRAMGLPEALARGLGAETGDAQQALLELSHSSSSNSGPIYMKSPTGKYFVLLYKQAKLATHYGFKAVSLESIPSSDLGEVNDMSRTGEAVLVDVLTFEGTEVQEPEEKESEIYDIIPTAASSTNLTKSDSVSVSPSASRSVAKKTASSLHEWASPAASTARTLACELNIHPDVRFVALGIGATLGTLKDRIERKVSDGRWSEKDLAALQKDLARFLELWLMIYHKKQRGAIAGFKSRTKGALAALRGKKGAEMSAAEEKRMMEQHRRAVDVAKFLDLPLPVPVQGDISKNLSLVTYTGQYEKTGEKLFKYGHAATFYHGHFNFTDADMEHASSLAYDAVQDLTGIPCAKVGKMEKSTTTDSPYLVVRSSKGEKIMEVWDYVVNTKTDNRVVTADSLLGKEIQSGIVTEAGWVAKIVTKTPFKLGGKLAGRVTNPGDKFLFSTMHIKPNAATAAPIVVHIQSTDIPARLTKGDTERLEIPLMAIRGFSDGTYVDLAVKESTRQEAFDSAGDYIKTSLLL